MAAKKYLRQGDQVHYQENRPDPGLAGIGPSRSDLGEPVRSLALPELPLDRNPRSGIGPALAFDDALLFGTQPGWPTQRLAAEDDAFVLEPAPIGARA